MTYGTDYNYRLIVYTTDNDGDPVYLISVMTVFTGPSYLNAYAVDDASISLEWDDNYSFETGFRLERDSGSGYVLINSPGAGVTEYTDTGLTYGVEYQYRVAAYADGNTSGYALSSIVSTFLTQPTGLTASILSDASLGLSWSDNCSFEDGYRLERDSGAGYVEIADLATNTEEYTDTGLTYGTDYNYRLIVYTTDNDGDPVYLISVMTVFTGPSYLNANAVDDASISLEWDDNYSFESGFRLERDSGSGFTLITSPGAGVTEYTDTGLTYGVEYRYKVAAYTDDNTSEYAMSSTLTTVFVGPSGIGAVAQDDASIDITWTDNSSSETSFTLQRSVDGGAFALLTSPVANATSYTDAGLSLNELSISCGCEYGNQYQRLEYQLERDNS